MIAGGFTAPGSEPSPMRFETPAIENRADLAAHFDSVADRSSGRLGAVLAVLDDGEVDAIYERAADDRFAAASTVKLPVLFAFHAARESGELPEPSRPHPLAPDNRVGGSGLLAILDGVPTLADLPRAMVAVSDNAATNELIDLLGMDAINEAADRLGTTDTHLGRKMMATLEGDEPETDEPINTTSPHDCLRFFVDSHREATLSADSYAAMREPLLKADTTFGRYLPYGTPIANKTGWLPSASLDAGLAYPEGERPLAFAVATDRLDHGAEGSDAIAAFGEAAYAWLTR